MVSLDIPALFILAACAVTLLAMALTYYTFTKRSTEMELRLLAEYRRAVAERVGSTVAIEEKIRGASDAAALARADVDGLRREIDDALSEVTGRLARAGMDVTTGVEEDDIVTDPRFELPAERSGVVFAFPQRVQ